MCISLLILFRFDDDVCTMPSFILTQKLTGINIVMVLLPNVLSFYCFPLIYFVLAKYYNIDLRI